MLKRLRERIKFYRIRINLLRSEDGRDILLFFYRWEHVWWAITSSMILQRHENLHQIVGQSFDRKFKTKRLLLAFIILLVSRNCHLTLLLVKVIYLLYHLLMKIRVLQTTVKSQDNMILSPLQVLHK